MNKMLSNGWLTAPLGAVVYLAATFLFWQKPAAPPRPSFNKEEAYYNNVGPSWDFSNPEADQLISELKNEKKMEDLRKQQLDDLQKRLDTERAELGQVIATVRQLQSDFDKSVLRVKAEESANLKKLAKVYASMTPDAAAGVLEQLDNAAIVKILLFLKDSETAAILEALSKKGDAAAKRTAEISEQIRLSSLAKPSK